MPGIPLDVRRLRKAIERDQLRLVYQPKADMRSGSILGVEALVRWENSRRGPVAPSEFVARAERSNSTIQALTDWTLDTAFAQAAASLAAGHDLTVAVNLSPRSALDPELPDRIGTLLHAHRVRPSSIELELTETAVFGVADPELVMTVLERLAEMGIVIALDDFGTGYSSLARLRDLPIHEVKIDRSFVSHMAERPHDALIVRSVIALSKGMHMRVVAEGVESDVCWHLLSELGCDVAQGNYLSKPLPPGELTTWVRQWEELYAEAHRMADELLERRRGPRDRRSGIGDRRGERRERRFARAT